MSINITKHFFLLVLSTVVTFVTVAQQVNKPDVSTVPVIPNANIFTPGAYGTAPNNYIRTWEAKGAYTNLTQLTSAGFEHVKQVTEYLDGLGRPLQTVVRQATSGPSPKDMVVPMVYDEFGREAYKFMPYVANSTDGLFRSNPFAEQKNYLETQYANPAEKVFYSKIEFEASPLNRLNKSMQQGNNWAGSNRGVEQKYLANTADDAVVIWSISNNVLTYTNNDETTNIPQAGAFYEPGQLYKSVLLDESGNASVEYTDKSGQIILKKVQAGSIAADYSGYNGFLCTYYVYDDFGNLRFVISPKAVEAIRPSWSFSGASTVINELCFRYEFDHRQRMIAKKVPGADWVYMIYDMRDRMVLNQDGNMRTKNQWYATLYDVLDRPIVTGIATWLGTPAALQSIVSLQTATVTIPPGTPVDIPLSQPTYGDYVASNSITLNPGFEAAVGGSSFSARIISENGEAVTVEGMSINKYPIPIGTPLIALTVTYYDNYGWTNKSYTTAYNVQLNDVGTDANKLYNLHPEDLPAAASQKTTGLVTGMKVRVLKDPGNLSLGEWLTSVNFYDDKGRVVQTTSDNHKSNPDIITTRYDFTDKVVGTYLVHRNPEAGANSIRIKTIYRYDAGGRPVEVWKTMNDDELKKVLLSSNEYNELGQLIRKNLGQQKDASTGNYINTPIEIQNYTYNVRGWLQGINKDYAMDQPSGSERWFGMELNYDWGFQTKQFNGNMAGMKWRSKGDGETVL